MHNLLITFHCAAYDDKEVERDRRQMITHGMRGTERPETPPWLSAVSKGHSGLLHYGYCSGLLIRCTPSPTIYLSFL